MSQEISPPTQNGYSAVESNKIVLDASMIIVGLVTFVGDSARGILFPALWPLCQELGGSTVDLGFLVSTFSFGRLIISARMGKISDKYRHRFALLLSGVVLVIGAILWANSVFLGGLPMLYVAQLTLGLGTGSLGVTRSYVVEQAPPRVRTYMLARLSALQYAGFAATPLCGSALVVAGAMISNFWKFALPAYLITTLAVLCLALLMFVFEDIKGGDVELPALLNPLLGSEKGDRAVHHIILSLEEGSKSTHQNAASSTVVYIPLKSEVENDQLKSDNDDDALCGSYIGSPIHPHSTNTQLLLASEAPPASNSPSSPSSPSAVPVLSAELMQEQMKVFALMILLNFTTRGAIAVYETQSSRILLDTYGLSQLQLGGIVSIAGVIGTLQLVFFKQVWTKNFSDINLMMGGLCFLGLSQLLVVNLGEGIIVPLWQYLLALFSMYAIGYPVVNSAVLGSFSTIQKAGRQAKAQGQFALMGSLARVVFPILSGLVEEYFEETAAFALVMLTMGVSLFGVVSMHNRILLFTSSGGAVSAVPVSGGDSSSYKQDSVHTVMKDAKLLVMLTLAAAFVIISVIGMQYD